MWSLIIYPDTTHLAFDIIAVRVSFYVRAATAVPRPHGLSSRPEFVIDHMNGTLSIGLHICRDIFPGLVYSVDELLH